VVDYAFPRVTLKVLENLVGKGEEHKYVNGLECGEVFSLVIGEWRQDVASYYASTHTGELVTIKWRGRSVRFVPTSKVYTVSESGVREEGGLSKAWK
jgi:hypothetical protein